VNPRRVLLSGLAALFLVLAGTALLAELTELKHSRQLPSISSVPEHAVADGLPILSISIPERDLHDKRRGLYRNILKKGRAWERQAFVSYFNDGVLKFSSGVGLRLHGGRSRHAERKSFRLMFRDEYGADRFPAGELFSPGIDPLTSFVLDAAKDDATQLVDPIALDIARMIGAIAPETAPVRFYLNGTYMGVYFAMEHISRRYLRAHYGHDNFTMVRIKHLETVSGRGDDYRRFAAWVKQTDFNMAELAQRVDLENFARWVISVLLCLTVDHDQGPVIRDDSPGSDGRWFYINWDMDTSFGVAGRWGPEPWEQDGVRVFGLGTTRKTMLTRMHKNDPEWRRYFLRLLVDILNHEMTPAKVQALNAHYESIVERFELGEPGRHVLSVVGKVLEHRPRVMRGWVLKHFDVEDARRLEVRVPEELELSIDGYPRRGPYVGWYFPDMPITIRPSSADSAIRGWLVDGEAREGPDLTLTGLMHDVVIEPLLANQSS
jgi:hypothetical protein